MFFWTLFKHECSRTFLGIRLRGGSFRPEGVVRHKPRLGPENRRNNTRKHFDMGFQCVPPWVLDVVWASHCCTQYSCARTSAKTPRNLVLADSLVKRSLEIIDYFQPRVWFVENPTTGLLKTRPFMEGLPWVDLDYCCYCNWGYRKRTRLWTNSGFVGRLCGGTGVCPNIEGKRHRSTAQQGRNKTPTGLHGEIHSTRALYRIPPALCEELEVVCRLEP